MAHAESKDGGILLADVDKNESIVPLSIILSKVGN